VGKTGSVAFGVSWPGSTTQKRARERRLEGLAVIVLTEIGERDGAVRDAPRSRGARTMTDDEGLSRREAVEW
jgi:hypothetical protein